MSSYKPDRGFLGRFFLSPRLWLVLVTGLQIPFARGGIDFTPVPGERKLEQSVFQQLIFHEGGQKISYEQPRGWTYSGGGNSITLTPPDVTQAKALIEQSALGSPQTFDEATTKNLQTQVLGSVPQDGQNRNIVGEENNAILIKGQPTYEVTVSYTYFGQDYEISVLFANLPGTQLRFRVTARKQDFEKVHRLFRGSLCSLQWHK